MIEAMMNKKTIIISVVSVILIAGVVFGVLIVMHSPKKEVPLSQAEPTKLSADGTKDYGACELLKTDLVQSTIGSVAANIQNPQKVGVALLPGGDQVEVCSYAFEQGGTEANSFNSTNAFTVEVFLHKDKASKDTYLASHTEGATLINGLGEKATYTFEKLSDERVIYSLVVYSGTRHFTFSINQTKATNDITKESAKDMLITLAKSVTF